MLVLKKLGIFAVATVMLVFAAILFWGVHGFRGPLFAFLLLLRYA